MANTTLNDVSRSTDLVSPGSVRSELDAAASRERADQIVTDMLNRSYGLLSQAVAASQTDPMTVVDIKRYVATVEEAAKQKNVSRNIQLDAAEMSRRAEYWLEKALRDAEANGELAGKGGDHGNQYTGGKTLNERFVKKKPSRSDFVNSYREGADLAKMGVATPEQFEQANREARLEGNPSRANVVRKIQEATTKNALPPKRKRQPLPDLFNTQIVQLNKTVSRLSDLAEDDRFTANKENVATMIGSDISRAISQLTKVLNKLNN